MKLIGSKGAQFQRNKLFNTLLFSTDSTTSKTETFNVLKKYRKELKSLNNALESATSEDKPRLSSAKARVEAAVRAELSGGERRWARRSGTPRGTADVAAPSHNAALRRLVRVFGATARRAGAAPLTTPSFHFDETLFGDDSASVIRKEAFALKSFKGEDLSLRFDLTIPFARYVAEHGIRSDRRFQIGTVFRRENPTPSLGRFSEFIQADMDIAGPSSPMVAESECLSVLSDFLCAVNLPDHEIKFNHRVILDGILELAGVAPVDFRTVSSSLDKLDKKSWTEVEEELQEVHHIAADVTEHLKRFVAPGDGSSLSLDDLASESRLTEKAPVKKALGELSVLRTLGAESSWAPRLAFSPSLARGLDYYTGLIFEAHLLGHGVGSVGGGGRYDGLIGQFTRGPGVKAVGVSLGLSRLAAVLAPSTAPEAPADIYVISPHGGLVPKRLAMTQRLRRHGYSVLCSTVNNPGLLNQFAFCESSGIEWGIVFGDGELENGLLKLRHIPTKTDTYIQAQDLIAALAERIPTPLPV